MERDNEKKINKKPPLWEKQRQSEEISPSQEEEFLDLIIKEARKRGLLSK